MSDDLLERAKGTLATVARDFPSPIASLAAELNFQLSAARPDFTRCFLVQIDLFEASVAFFSFVQLAQLDALSLGPRSATQAVSELRDNPKLCTGHWWGLLRELSRDVKDVPGNAVSGPASLLSKLYFDPSGGVSSMGRVLDEVPGLRNKVKGHTWTLAAEQYEKAALDLLRSLTGYLGKLAGLSEWFLFHVVGCHQAGEMWAVDVAHLCGDSRRPARLTLSSVTPLQVGRVYLHVEPFSGVLSDLRLDPAQILPLHPFVEVDAAGTIRLLQGISGEGARMAAVVGGDSLDAPSAGAEARAILDRLLGKAGRRRSDLEDALGRMRAAAREALSSTSARASYDAATYVVRPRLIDLVDGFVQGPSLVGVLSGPSGSGKTALACHVTERWLAADSGVFAMVFVFARDLAGRGESLKQWWSKMAGRAVALPPGSLGEDEQRLLVVLDGIEQVPPAVQQGIWEDLEALTRQDAGSGGHFLLLLTDVAARALETDRATAELMRRSHRMLVPPLDREEALAMLAVGRGDGGTPASFVSSGVLDVLTSPLLVRFAREAGDLARTEGVTPGQILLSFCKEKVFGDLSRTAIVNGVLDGILETREKSVPVSSLSSDPWLKSIVLAGGPGSPLGALVEERVLSLEWKARSGNLPLPGEARLGVVFDRLLEFLLFTRLVDRRGASPEGLAAIARNATPFPPLVGALRILCNEMLSRASEAESAGTEEAVVGFLSSLAGEVREPLLAELLASGIRLGVEDAAGRACRRLFERLDEAGRISLLAAAAVAFERAAMKGDYVTTDGLASLLLEVCVPDRVHAIPPVLLDQVELVARNRNAGEAVDLARGLVATTRSAGATGLEIGALASLSMALSLAGRTEEADAALDELRARRGTGAELDPSVAFLSARAETSEYRRKGEHAKKRTAQREARRLARESGKASWLAIAAILELGDELSAGSEASLERIDALLEEALAAARKSGWARLEAEVRRMEAWRHQDDPAREELSIEDGLRAARAGRDEAEKARLLYRRATLLVRLGRLEEAAAVAGEVSGLFRSLGHRREYLKTQEHHSSVIDWELGRLGQVFSTLGEVFEGLISLQSWEEAALGALLLAEISCELGDPVRARGFLARAAELNSRARKPKDLHDGLVRAGAAVLEGNSAAAEADFRSALAWGTDRKYPDFIFQPALGLARLFLSPHGAVPPDPARAREVLRQLDGQSVVDVKHRARYAGEIETLHALASLHERNLEEARIWLEHADAWFEKAPHHRARMEWKAAGIALQWLEAERLEAGALEAEGLKAGAAAGSGRDGARHKAKGLQKSATTRAREQVLAVLEGTAADLSGIADAAAYIACQPAIRVLESFRVPTRSS